MNLTKWILGIQPKCFPLSKYKHKIVFPLLQELTDHTTSHLSSNKQKWQNNYLKVIKAQNGGGPGSCLTSLPPQCMLLKKSKDNLDFLTGWRFLHMQNVEIRLNQSHKMAHNEPKMTCRQVLFIPQQCLYIFWTGKWHSKTRNFLIKVRYYAVAVVV